MLPTAENVTPLLPPASTFLSESFLNQMHPTVLTQDFELLGLSDAHENRDVSGRIYRASRSCLLPSCCRDQCWDFAAFLLDGTHFGLDPAHCLARTGLLQRGNTTAVKERWQQRSSHGLC